MSTYSQRAFFLNAGDRALAATGLLPHAPRGAVLLALPPMEERKGALPVCLALGRELAARGIAALLVDWSGCGDSEGDFDSTPPRAFEEACEAALAWLERSLPLAPRALLGVRAAAPVACRVARTHPELAGLVLWSPVAGPDFLRQLMQRRMVNDMVAYGKARDSRAALETELRDGRFVDMDGYAVTGAFYAWAQSLSLEPTPLPTWLATGGHDEKAAAALASQVPALTQSALRYPPFWNTVGHVDVSALVRETADWLAARFTGPGHDAPDWSEPCVCHLGELVDLTPSPVVRAALDRPAKPPRGGVLFLHGWSGDRTGPHRLFTRFGRLLADDGFLCLRPDFVGRGLSDGAASDASIARMADNAQAALQALRARLPAGAPIAVVAICSGCKVAVALAAREPGIARLALWSPESMGSLRSSATGARKTLHALAAYARKLTRPEAWKKLLTGKVQTGMVAKALVKHETRSADEARWEDDVLEAFRTYRGEVLATFGGSDPDAPGSSRAYASYCRNHRIPFEAHTIAHAGHSYYGEAWTRELLDVTARFLRR